MCLLNKDSSDEACQFCNRGSELEGNSPSRRPAFLCIDCSFSSSLLYCGREEGKGSTQQSVDT